MSAYQKNKPHEPYANTYAVNPGNYPQQQQQQQQHQNMANYSNHDDDDDPTSHRESSPKLGTKRQVRGAAVAGGLTGFVLLGPAAGLLAAGGAALAVKEGRGDVGKAARAAGDSVSDLGKSLKKFERKHSIKEKTTKGILKSCDWVSKKLGPENGSSSQQRRHP